MGRESLRGSRHARDVGWYDIPIRNATLICTGKPRHSLAGKLSFIATKNLNFTDPGCSRNNYVGSFFLAINYSYVEGFMSAACIALDYIHRLPGGPRGPLLLHELRSG